MAAVTLGSVGEGGAGARPAITWVVSDAVGPGRPGVVTVTFEVHELLPAAVLALLLMSLV